MSIDDLFFATFVIFSGAWVLATLVLYSRQSLLVAYMLLGALVGPYTLDWLNNADQVRQIGNVGIIFLLFLVGLELHLPKLISMLQKSMLITLLSSAMFVVLLTAIAYLFNMSLTNAVVMGTALMFSSTIIGLKLMPTTALHHQHVGKLIISILLIQDLLAIVTLISIDVLSGTKPFIDQFKPLLFGLPALMITAFGIERIVLTKLIARFDRIKEYIFLLSIGWCMSMAQLAEHLGLSHEVGAFIAGVALAEGSIAWFIAESLKPLRDFFLVMFFFTVGAGFNYHVLVDHYWIVLTLSAVVLLVKPFIFKVLLERNGESKKVGWEVGWRLGQASEFSLLIAFILLERASDPFDPLLPQIIQAVTIASFVISSYVVVMFYPTPISHSDKLRRD